MTPRQRLDLARARVLGEGYGEEGIGTLSERSLHRILKLYFEPDEALHEVKFLGKVCDIKNAQGITEIQTRHLSALVPKLERFLPECPVTVVYPLDRIKYISTVKRESGEILPRKKSPKHCTVYDSFYELYNIRSFLSSPNLTVKLVFLESDEFRYDSGKAFGRRRKRERAERIPNAIVDTVTLASAEDYKVLVPPTLASEFSATDFNRAVGKGFAYGYSGIQILIAVGLAEKIGKVGRSIMYRLTYEREQ